MIMKRIKVVFLLFACLFIYCQCVDAKEAMYGNIKMRSLGVGNNPNLPKQHVVLINSNGEMQHYQRSVVGSFVDVACVNRGVSVYNYPTLQINSLVKSDNMFANSEPTITSAVVYYSFGGGENPNHPGVPIGDALPFVVLLAGGYVYKRNRE